jgi:hypothetical protein
MALRAVLIVAAGVASLAFLALRTKVPPTITRELDLASLERHVGNWLPKLPFVPFIRIAMQGTGDALNLTGDGTAVQVCLPQTSRRQRDLGPAFRRACTTLGLDVRHTSAGRGEPSLCCDVPVDGSSLARVLETLLREVFGAKRASKLVAAIPTGS